MDKTTFILTDHCRFHLGDEPDAWQSWFQDEDWEEVTLPHDWSVTLPFSREYSSGTGYLAGGIGWYRLRITPRKEWQGKRISLVFDGIYKNSRIWCNSCYLGSRPNGYISFSLDITDTFRFDKDNLVAIRVDHTDISDSRWFTGSGITRCVRLVVQEAVHPLWNGVFFTTPKVSSTQAHIAVANEICNTLPVETAVTVTNRLLYENSTVITFGSADARLLAGECKTLHTSFSLNTPALWSCESPTLYTLETVISFSSPEGISLSFLADVQKVGIRTFSFHPDQGFFLNGKPTLLQGVCLHHDAGCLGAAVYAPVWRRRLLKLKQMGCNAIRTSHNPHMPQLYDLCDELGFLVIDEAFDEWEGPKNKWWKGHNVYPPRHQGYYTDFPNWHKQDLTDLVRRDRNHPSVILWSIGNEIDYPNDPYCHPSFDSMIGNNDINKPAAEQQYNPDRPNAKRLAPIAAHLRDIVRQSDTTRPVTLAAAFPELSAKIGFLDSLDVVGYNYKEHLYAQSHADFPQKPFIGSENGHDLAAWRAVTDNDYISGQFLWPGIDYLGEAPGWPVHGFGAGLLTLAGFEKPGYYRRQSFWSKLPMVHLVTAFAEADCGEFTPVSECWNFPKGCSVLVKCYTNLTEAEFFLNERSLGIHKKETDSDCISLTVPFEVGVLTVRAGKEGPSHSLFTTGCACQIHLASFAEEIPGTDSVLYQAELTMQDGAGHRVYQDASMLHVQVSGGRLLGIENGDLTDATDYGAAYRRAYRGQLLLYVLSRKGDAAAHITVTGDHMYLQKSLY